MTDITTVEEVQAGEYTVRVARDEDNWEAVVVDTNSSSDSATVGPLSMQMMTISSTSSDDGSDDEIQGPPATAPHMWVAVGFAIEAYEWQQICEETVGVEEAYSEFVANVDIDTDADGNPRVFDSDGPSPEQFSAEFSIGGGGDD